MTQSPKSKRTSDRLTELIEASVNAGMNVTGARVNGREIVLEFKGRGDTTNPADLVDTSQ